MSRVIRIDSCDQCPSRDHKGAFGNVMYVPVCLATDRELPHDVVVNKFKRLVAHASNVTPEWCPLEKATESQA
jgi:hypothetical protein